MPQAEKPQEFNKALTDYLAQPCPAEVVPGGWLLIENGLSTTRFRETRPGMPGPLPTALPPTAYFLS